MKEYLIKLIDDKCAKIQGYEVINTSVFRGIINDTKQNIYKFMARLSDKEIDVICSMHDDSESFKANIIFIREYLKIEYSRSEEIKLDDKQDTLIEIFISLIDKVIYKIEHNKYRKFKERLCLGVALKEDDYETAKELVGINDDKYLDAMNYLNRFNLPLIQIGRKKQNKKEVHYVKVEEYNPFDKISTEYIPKENSKQNRQRKYEQSINNDEIIIDDYLKRFGYSLSNLNSNDKKLLLQIDDKSKLHDIVQFMFDANLVGYLDSVSPLIYMMINSEYISKETFKNIKETYSPDTVKHLVNTYYKVFNKEEYIKFRYNVSFLRQYGIEDIEYVIKNNINFFYDAPAVNYCKVKILEEYNLNVYLFIKYNLNTFCLDIDLLTKNIELLNRYGYDLTDEVDYSSFTVLGQKHLQYYLDKFIKDGYTDYIHEEPDKTLRRLKALIIKDVYNSCKNNQEIVYDDEDNLSDEDIEVLLNDYPILEVINNMFKIDTYDDSYYGIIKRKTELNVGGKIVSKYKFYTDFNKYIKMGLKSSDAIMNALKINKEEYDKIYDVLTGIKENTI